MFICRKTVIWCIALSLLFTATLFSAVSAEGRSLNTVDRVTAIEPYYISEYGPISVLTIREDEDFCDHFSEGQLFRLTLKPGVKWISAEVNTLLYKGEATLNGYSDRIQISRISDTTLEVVMLGPVDHYSVDIIQIPLWIDVNGVLGDIYVTVEGIDSNVSSGTYTFAISRARIAEINIAEVNAFVGEKNVRLPVTFDYNPGIGAAVLEFSIPSGLTLVAIEDPQVYGLTFRYVPGTRRAVIEYDLNISFRGYRGERFATLIFDVDAVAAEGLHAVTLTSTSTDEKNNISDPNAEYIGFTVSPGGINVRKHKRGFIANGGNNSFVGTADLVHLGWYIAGDEIRFPYSPAMHIANDGKNTFVGAADYVHLAWYIAGGPDYSLDSPTDNRATGSLAAPTDDLIIRIAEVDARPGDTGVRVPVIFENSPGVGAAALEFSIPDGLTLVSIEDPQIEGLTFRYVSGGKRATIGFDPELMPEGYKGEVFATLILDVDEVAKGLLGITLTSATTDARNNISDSRADYQDFVVLSGGVNADSGAPTISGPETMALSVGYTAVSSGVYTITGTPTPVVTKTSGNAAITWNDGTKKLDIAAGLAVGSYPVELVASNAVGDASITFTLNVQSGSSPGSNPGSSPGGGGGGSATASISPARVDYKQSDGGDVAITLTSGAYRLTALKNGDNALVEGVDYTTSNGVVTLGAAYLKTLDPGRQVITFVMNAGTNPTLTITVTGEVTTGEETITVVPIGPTPVPLAPTVNPFIDVKQSEWFYDDVLYVYNNDLMKGTSANTFAPDMNLTRGMVVTVLYRLYGSVPTNDYSNPFSDVQDGMYYTEAVKWAAANDIVTGYDNGLYGPDDLVTREQLAAIIYRYQLFSGDLPASIQPSQDFADGDSISLYARDAVSNLAAQGIIGGKPGNLFDPQGNATRAEYAAILHRLFG